MLESEAAQLAATFTAASRRLHARDSSDSTLQEVVGMAVSLVEGADYAGVSVRGPASRFESPAYTDDMVLTLDRLQQEVGEGPCVDAMADSPVLHIADMEQERRWPRFAGRARELGIHSMLCCQFPGEPGIHAALNIHGRRRHVFDSLAIETATVFAAHASIAFAQAGLIESLHTAIYSRQHIGEATGILMERHRIGSREAFEMLVKVSQHTNVKLRDVASDFVSTRKLPAT